MQRSLSIWIVPPPDLRWRLESFVARRGEGPAFTPHVTLVGDLRSDPAETLAAVHGVASSVLPLSIRFEGIETGTSFFRSVFLRVHPTAELLRAHRASCEALGVTPNQDFDPHLSLAYGHVSTAELAVLQRQVHRREIPGSRFRADALTVAHAASTVPIAKWVEIETIAPGGSS